MEAGNIKSEPSHRASPAWPRKGDHGLDSGFLGVTSREGEAVGGSLFIWAAKGTAAAMRGPYAYIDVGTLK